MIEQINEQFDSTSTTTKTFDVKHVSVKKRFRFDFFVNNTHSKLCFHFISFHSLQLVSRFTADTIINITYGLNATNELHNMLMEWFHPSLIKNIGSVILSRFPALESIYKQRFFPLQMTEWFYEIFDYAVQQRHQMQTNRMDFLQFLLKRQQIKNHSMKDMAAFAASFVFNGYETSGIMLAQALYHLARNDRCQMELRKEIIKYLPYESCATIDMIDEMPYLDNVVNGMFVGVFFTSFRFAIFLFCILHRNDSHCTVCIFAC